MEVTAGTGAAESVVVKGRVMVDVWRDGEGSVGSPAQKELFIAV